MNPHNPAIPQTPDANSLAINQQNTHLPNLENFTLFRKFSSTMNYSSLEEDSFDTRMEKRVLKTKEVCSRFHVTYNGR